MEKADQIADSVQSIENRNFHETKEEKHQFIQESFNLDENKIFHSDKKLREAAIKLFIDNFKGFATNLSQYGETKLQMKIDLITGAFPYKSKVKPLNPDQKDNLRKQIDEWLEQGVIEPSVILWASLLVPV